MEPYLCKDCSHFRQHYILDASSCTAIDCGHCVYPRLKHRRAHAPACSSFALRDTPPPLPATRYFLSAGGPLRPRITKTQPPRGLRFVFDPFTTSNYPEYL